MESDENNSICKGSLSYVLHQVEYRYYKNRRRTKLACNVHWWSSEQAFNTNMDITPKSSPMPWLKFPTWIKRYSRYTKIIFPKNFWEDSLLVAQLLVQRLDVEYVKFFLCEKNKGSYLVNYIRLSTFWHGNVKRIIQGLRLKQLSKFGVETYFVTLRLITIGK